VKASTARILWLPDLQTATPVPSGREGSSEQIADIQFIPLPSKIRFLEVPGISQAVLPNEK